MSIRKAEIADVEHIRALVNKYAEEDKMLPRSLNELYDNVRDFWIAEENGVLVGCCALHVVWDDLAEVKSLAISGDFTGKGIGKELVIECIEDAKQLKIKKVFALTYITDFFYKLGFTDISKEELPHKIWSECIKCPKFPNCDEKAVLYEVT